MTGGLTIWKVLFLFLLPTHTYKAFSPFTAEQDSGLPLPELARAVEELVDLGSLDVEKKAFLGRRMTLPLTIATTQGASESRHFHEETKSSLAPTGRGISYGNSNIKDATGRRGDWRAPQRPSAH
ncbi:hypothetical protein R75461_07474 [Paraburkholderia nemoris]|nr:hypothetical protein R75461_07474 [Paraburkholderia nemoris]